MFVQVFIFISRLVSICFLWYKKGLKVMSVIAPQQQWCYRSQVRQLFVARDLQVSPVAFLQSPQGEIGGPPETRVFEILVRWVKFCERHLKVLRFWGSGHPHGRKLLDRIITLFVWGKIILHISIVSITVLSFHYRSQMNQTHSHHSGKWGISSNITRSVVFLETHQLF